MKSKTSYMIAVIDELVFAALLVTGGLFGIGSASQDQLPTGAELREPADREFRVSGAEQR